MIEVGFARDGEAEAITAVMRAAAEWAARAGHSSWSPDQLTEEETASRIGSFEQLCARSGRRVVGVARLEREDELFWPDRSSGEALYLHKLAVIREMAGAGVSSALIAWAVDEARRAGRAFVRLDCAPRPKLCAIYERLGFARLDERVVGPHHVFRYERAV